jgi:hypothetical protein
MTKRPSGAQRSNENVALFEAYVKSLKERGEPLPTKLDGQINLSKIAADSGIGDRGRLYTNDRVRSLLEQAEAELPRPQLAEPQEGKDGGSKAAATDAALQRTERRLHRLEQQNAALVAENAELRRQNIELRLQLGREDMMIETGRRIPAPPEGV